MRRTRVHPNLARQIATHVIEKVWAESTDDYEQVQPGVFVGEDAVVVLGAAAVSEPGENALRLTGRVWELAALLNSHAEPLVYGPRHLYGEDEWGDILSRCVALTRACDTVLTTFEVVAVSDEHMRADVAAVSAVVGASMPATDAEPDEGLLRVLLEQVDAAVEAA